MDEFSNLFYKVFHNKYLFNIIINSIQTVQWVNYDSIQCYNIDNRKKFKDIQSLEWMIKNKQYELLKDKLENNQPVEIDREGIYLLILQYKWLPSTFQSKGYYRIGDELKKIKNTEQQTQSSVENDWSNKQDSILLLLKYKQDELLKLNFPNAFLEPVILNSTPAILDFLLNLPIVQPISDELKRCSIYRARKNKHQTMLEYVLNNPQLYAIPSSSTTEDIRKLDLTDAPGIGSLYVRNKLYELQYFVDRDYVNNEDSYNDFIHNEIFKSFQGGQSTNNHVGAEYPFHSLVHFRAVHEKCAFALNYLKSKKFKKTQVKITKYTPRIIPETVSNISSEYATLYLEGYIQFHDKQVDIYIVNFILTVKSEQEYQHFRKLVTNCFNFLPFPVYWFDINKLKTNSNGGILIENLQDLEMVAENSEFIQTYLSCQSYIKSKTYKFNDYDVFLFQVSSLIEHARIVNPTKFKFIESSFNIYHYSFSNAVYQCDTKEFANIISLMDNYGWNEQLFNTFYNIDQRDIHGNEPYVAKNIDHSSKNQVPFNFNGKSISSISTLFNYLNSIGYKLFTPSLFSCLIGCVCATRSLFTSGNEFKSLEINFNQFQLETIYLFIGSIKDYVSPNVIQLILFNSLKLSSIIKTQIMLKIGQDWDDFGGIRNKTIYFYGRINDHAYEPKFHTKLNSALFFKDSNLHISRQDYNLDSNDDIFYCTSFESSQDIISIINSLLVDCQLTVVYENGLSWNLILVYQKIINYLFKRLIKIGNIKSGLVVDCYTGISTKWLSITNRSFNFDHTIYHIVYYLGIKSLKFIKFIMSLPLLDHLLISIDGNAYKETDYNGNPDIPFDLFRILDSNVYSFEFIFNSPFHVVLERLVNDLLIYSYQSEADLTFKSFNSTLKFLLEIREIDYFFVILRMIISSRDIHFKFSPKLIEHSKKVLDPILYSQFKQSIDEYKNNLKQ